METQVFDIAAFVSDVFYPCVTIGMVLAGVPALFTGVYRGAMAAFGLLDLDR